MLLQFVDILSSYCTTFDLVVIALHDVDFAEEESKIKQKHVREMKNMYIFEQVVHIKQMTRRQKTMEEKKENSTLNG